MYQLVLFCIAFPVWNMKSMQFDIYLYIIYSIVESCNIFLRFTEVNILNSRIHCKINSNSYWKRYSIKFNWILMTLLMVWIHWKLKLASYRTLKNAYRISLEEYKNIFLNFKLYIFFLNYIFIYKESAMIPILISDSRFFLFLFVSLSLFLSLFPPSPWDYRTFHFDAKCKSRSAL